MVYVMFAPQYPLLALEPAVARSSALVLAHSADPGLQKYVADVLFAKASANGRLAMGVGQTFSAGTGCDIRPGMKPGRLIPEDYGMKSYILRKVDDWAQKGVDEAAYPGCRVLVMKNGQVVYDEGFGTHSTLDTTAVRSTDLFDLADLTKPMATVLAVMKLYDEGRLKLDDKASAYLPVLRRTDKQDITVRDLLLNEAGLAPHIRFYMDAIDPRSVHGPYAQSGVDEWHKTRISEHSYFCSDFAFKKGLVSSQKTTNHTLHMAEDMWMNKSFKNTILQQIARSDLEGRRYIYSQVGFILLQQVVEKLSGLPMDLYVAKEFYAPMGLLRTMFLPLSKYPKEEIMPTATNDFLRRQDLCGYVYDEAAACLGGVSGKALDRFLSDFDKAYAKLSARGRRSQAFTIDQIRAIQSFLQTGGDRDKAVILENIEDVTVGAMNSILKVLEEPPSGAHIILLSRNARRILPTILSRVRQYEFPPVSLERQSALISDLFFSQGNSVEDFIVSAAGLDLAGLEARADELMHQTLVKGRLLDDETLSSLAAFLDEMGSWDLFVTKLAAICEDGFLHGVLEPLRAKRALELLSACQRDATVYAQNRRVMLERIQRGLVAL